MQALSIELDKPSQDERQQHNYTVPAKSIKGEARKPMRVLDIAAMIKANKD